MASYECGTCAGCIGMGPCEETQADFEWCPEDECVLTEGHAGPCVDEYEMEALGWGW